MDVRRWIAGRLIRLAHKVTRAKLDGSPDWN